VNVIAADYLDGRRSVRHPVSLIVSHGKLKVIGRDVNEEFDLRRVRRSLRVGGTPRWLYLPGGGACVTADNDAVDRMTRKRGYDRLLYRWESRPAYAALATGVVVAALWLAFDRGVPVAAEHIAERIPVAAETTLGRQTLSSLDQGLLQPSGLSPERQGALREKFAAMAKAAGDATPYRLEFRASKRIGPNAFALPSGIIVMTDELVRLSRHDEELLAVLAHELGHVRHRHTMRRLLEVSATGLIIAGVTGDVASATSIAAAAPAILVQTRYSRDNEREADAYSVEVLGKAGINPRYMATILGRLEKKAGGRGGLPDFLASHPATKERQALALAAAGTEEVVEDVEPSGTAAAEVEPPRRMILDPVQRQVVELVQERDYEALDRLLGEQQLAFERDATASPVLDNAFRGFAKVPKRGEAALDDWVARNPGSYAARAGRASFFVFQGLEARGTAFFDETPEEHIRAMRAYLDKARADAEASLPMTPKPYISRRTLMTVARMLGRRKDAAAHYAEAIRMAPESMGTRLDHMAVLEPRWGGSYAEMEKFAAESRAQLKTPGAADRIAAAVPAYRAQESVRARDFPLALRQYDEAVALDPDAGPACGRAHVLSELKRFEDALADARRALSTRDDPPYCLQLAPYLAANAKDAGAAIAVMSLVLEVDPASIQALRQRGWRYQEQGRLELAFPDYLAAARLGDPWAQMMTGKLYWAGSGVKQDRDEAVGWLRKAAAQGDRDAKVSLEQALQELARK
jgi:Zn-dependent protease with chaperone function/tetratricopeptide (TPR) repeat protein